MKKNILFSILYHFLLGISFWTFLNGIYKVYKYKNDTNKTYSMNEKIKDVASIKNKENEENVFVNPPDDENDLFWNYKDVDFLEIDFSNLINQNSDTVAWIEVSGTDISEVVVQGSDNEFYLNHSFDKTENSSGWIFSDYRNNLEYLNNNTIIYGHTLKNKTMFSSLKNTLKEEWYNDISNYIIKLSTPKMNTIWQIFSIYTIPNENYYIKTSFTKDEYKDFLNNIKQRSIYDFKTSIDEFDKILTLSTCKGTLGNKLAIHAKLIKKETR